MQKKKALSLINEFNDELKKVVKGWSNNVDELTSVISSIPESEEEDINVTEMFLVFHKLSTTAFELKVKHEMILTMLKSEIE